jgi:hypothetical protein
MRGKNGFRENPVALSAEALTALGAASINNAAATDSSHAGTEAVTALANEFAWLICPFHWMYPVELARNIV